MEEQTVKESDESKKYFWLIVIIAVIALFFSAGNFVFLYWLRLFMGILFLVMGTLKIYNLEEFVEIFPEYDPIASRIKIYKYLYPFIELFVGAFYLFNLFLVTTNVLVIVVFTISLIGINSTLHRRGSRKLICGCMGGVIKKHLSRKSIYEDVFIIAAAALLLASSVLEFSF